MAGGRRSPWSGCGRAGAGPRCASVWPEAVDNLTSAVRAGLSLPEALGQLAVRGPVELRPAFAAFAEDYRATGRFADCLDRLKDRLADPVADRLVESLRIAREVGGSDLGRLLRTLAGFLREDARTRAELEARQSWTVNGARLAVAAPWIVLALLATRPEAVAAYDRPAGARGAGRRGRLLGRRLPADAPDRAAARGTAGAAMSRLAGSSAALGRVWSLGLGLWLVCCRVPMARRADPGRPAGAVPAGHPAAQPAARATGRRSYAVPGGRAARSAR